uniref:Uncharacterized protein n=1 Tax=Oryza rufipogon TaxID=4529 RepID=A0A0E0N0I5_ORYRU
MWDYSTISPFTHWCPSALHRPFTVYRPHRPTVHQVYGPRRIVKGISHPKSSIEVRGSPTYILGHLPFHNQCGTI